MNWQPHTDEQGRAGHRCTLHDTTFLRGEVCHRCAIDPGPAIAFQVGDDSRRLDEELLARAHHHETLALELERHASAMLALGGRDRVDAAKLVAEATKRFRLAAEDKDRVSQRDHQREAMDHDKQIRGMKRGRN